MTPDAEAKARALAECVLRLHGGDKLPDGDYVPGCGCLTCEARALLVALDAEPQRLDRERLAKVILAWDASGDWTTNPEHVCATPNCWAERIADLILARLEADRG